MKPAKIFHETLVKNISLSTHFSHGTGWSGPADTRVSNINIQVSGSSHSWVETGSPRFADLSVGAGLNHGDASVPVTGSHIVTLVHQQLVLDQNPPRLLQLIVLLLIAPLEVLHVEQHDLHGGCHPPLLLHCSELFRWWRHARQWLLQHSNLLLKTPQDLPGVRLMTQSGEWDKLFFTHLLQHYARFRKYCFCSIMFHGKSKSFSDQISVTWPVKANIFNIKLSSYLFRHWTEVLSCRISSSAFLSAISLWRCCSSNLSASVILSVLNASEREENLFSMSWSDKFSALKNYLESEKYLSLFFRDYNSWVSGQCPLFTDLSLP